MITIGYILAALLTVLVAVRVVWIIAEVTIELLWKVAGFVAVLVILFGLFLAFGQQ